MIKGLEFSIKNLGGGELYTPQEVVGGQSLSTITPQQFKPGWYWHSDYGWVYVDASGETYTGNPYTGLLYQPLWLGDFVAEFVYPATQIGGPINVVSGDNIEVKWSFLWEGPGRDIDFRFGNCKRIAGNHYNAGDWELKTVTVSTSTTPVLYTATDQFQYLSAAIWDNRHLFILPVNIQFDVVYEDAFAELSGEISDLEITDYARL